MLQNELCCTVDMFIFLIKSNQMIIWQLFLVMELCILLGTKTSNICPRQESSKLLVCFLEINMANISQKAIMQKTRFLKAGLYPHKQY